MGTCNETRDRQNISFLTNNNSSNNNINNNINNNNINSNQGINNTNNTSNNNLINNSNNLNNSNGLNNNINNLNNNNEFKKFTFNGTKNWNLIVHKNDGMNDYVIELTLTKFDKNRYSNKETEFIMILDVSGSMSGHVHKLVSDIIPKGLNMLNYSDNFSIHLITFESQVRYYKRTIRELKNDYSLEGDGGTEMANVYEKVKFILNNNSLETNYNN